MNSKAKALLQEAKGLLERGEEFYRQAAEKIIAAQEADPTLSNREIGEWFGHSEFWVRDVVLRVTNPSERSELYEKRTEAEARAKTRRTLRDLPAEEIAETYLSDPAVRGKINKAHAIASEEYERRGHAAKERSERKFREDVGAEVADELDFTQELRDTEYELVRARQALAGFLKRASALDREIPEAWTTSCDSWLDDITAKVELARGLLAGDAIDDALAQMLDEARP